MNECAIILNGELSELDWIRPYLSRVTQYIAADGGARHALKHNLPVTTLIGDFDSIPREILEHYRSHGVEIIEREILEHYRSNGVEIIEHPVDKDATDLELAVRFAHARGAQVIHLLGTEGGRTDHLLGIMTLIGNSDFAQLRLWAYDRTDLITAVHGGNKITLESHPGARFSIIPITAEVKGVTLTGTRWELEKATLRLGSSLSLSNVAVASSIEFRVESGVAILMLERPVPGF